MVMLTCEQEKDSRGQIVVGDLCQLMTAVHLKSGTAAVFRIGDPILVGGAAIRPSHPRSAARWYLNGADQNDQRRRTATIQSSHAAVNSQF